MEFFYLQADVPPELWGEFSAVIACESNFNPWTVGDEGSAVGLLQIHEQPWNTPWSDGRYDLTNPTDTLELALLIQEYDLIRNRDRWHQWSIKPHWPECQQRAKERSIMIFIFTNSVNGRVEATLNTTHLPSSNIEINGRPFVITGALTKLTSDTGDDGDDIECKAVTHVSISPTEENYSVIVA